jgi:hypothetical protein
LLIHMRVRVLQATAIIRMGKEISCHQVLLFYPVSTIYVSSVVAILVHSGGDGRL